MGLLVDAVADHLTLGGDWSLLHAVDAPTVRRRLDPEDPPTALCGASAHTAVVADQHGSPVLLAWPPHQRYELWRRCPECWEATGRRRPASSWRQLKGES